jgi:hypothetical protein
MMTALARGYATSSTDTGHVGNNASFALGHPEKAIDFAWRAVHEMAAASKKIIATYYDGGPKFSYWNGCSAGGRQAMKEAQRFPADLDVQVLCAEAEADKFSELILRQTTSFGVRRYSADRRKLRREIKEIQTVHGKVSVKLGWLDGQVVQAAPEFESCKQLAAAANVPLKAIYEAALKVLKTNDGC